MPSSPRDSTDAKRRPVALIVAEQGADWEGWSADAGDAPAVTVVERSSDDPETFAHRVRSAIEELDGEGRRIVSAVVVGGPAFNAAVLAARATILRALCASMLRAGGGNVLLAGPEGVRGAPVHAMAALAGVVDAELRGTGVNVTHREARKGRRPTSGIVARPSLREVA